MAYDGRDPNQRTRARAALVDTAAQEPPVPPRIAFVKTPIWAKADAETQEAFTKFAARHGSYVAEVALPDWFGEAIDWHQVIMESDLARSFGREYERGRDRLSTTLRSMIERGQTHFAVNYNRALGEVKRLNQSLRPIFADYDVILTPATTGTAPRGLEATGSPIFCTLWTLTGVPAITLPLLTGANGLPLGVQLVAAKGDDARLLRTARWLAKQAMSS